ncbi:hypothetical protein ASE85_16205 [Sphingobium sp. Leaf26]|nr:hypothetical protein ASE85_16205 [Sphingobium sp. Leaf26]
MECRHFSTGQAALGQVPEQNLRGAFALKDGAQDRRADDRISSRDADRLTIIEQAGLGRPLENI